MSYDLSSTPPQVQQALRKYLKKPDANGCILWSGPVATTSRREGYRYPLMKYTVDKGYQYLNPAHALYEERYPGKIPDGYFRLFPTCSSGVSCVNPEHRKLLLKGDAAPSRGPYKKRKKKRKRKTTCTRGHDLTVKDALLGDGKTCRLCNRINQKNYQNRLRAERPEEYEKRQARAAQRHIDERKRDMNEKALELLAKY